MTNFNKKSLKIRSYSLQVISAINEFQKDENTNFSHFHDKSSLGFKKPFEKPP